MWSADLTSAGASVRRSVNVRILALVVGVCIVGLVGYLVISGLLGHVGAGDTLGVNQQLTIDASTKNVTLVVDKKEKVALESEGVNALQLWNASGSPVYSTDADLDPSTGLFEPKYDLTAGQYRITWSWSKESVLANGKIHIMAKTKGGAPVGQP